MRTAGLNHIILTIGEVERSRAFYSGLLGFEVSDFEDGLHFEVGEVAFFLFPSGQPLPDDRFNEFRIGLDHLAFTAPDRAVLHELSAKLIAAGVETKGVETFRSGNQYVAFRDPDHIQLEYWLPDQEEKD